MGVLTGPVVSVPKKGLATRRQRRTQTQFSRIILIMLPVPVKVGHLGSDVADLCQQSGCYLALNVECPVAQVRTGPIQQISADVLADKVRSAGRLLNARCERIVPRTAGGRGVRIGARSTQRARIGNKSAVAEIRGRRVHADKVA